MLDCLLVGIKIIFAARRDDTDSRNLGTRQREVHPIESVVIKQDTQ